VRVEGNNGNAVLSVGTAGGMTNNGAIELTTVGSSFSSQLTVTNGSLTNASGGTITSVVGAAGPRTLMAQLIISTLPQFAALGDAVLRAPSGNDRAERGGLLGESERRAGSITTRHRDDGADEPFPRRHLNLTGGTLADGHLSCLVTELGIDVTNAVTTLGEQLDIQRPGNDHERVRQDADDVGTTSPRRALTNDHRHAAAARSRTGDDGAGSLSRRRKQRQCGPHGGELAA
jgi:hypothetical protein